ncbi:hypothetical protein ONE63_008525 [Megalurothrips usitatus]|uniref:Uncharacterized protein n=1 Tax=Megalurothrips usitatus TaxID=439358 RepID=A0AAV7XT06_9NEOP|nr:hypothetical protein ONE63_008525 [Megalurothrips usitatus]
MEPTPPHPDLRSVHPDARCRRWRAAAIPPEPAVRAAWSVAAGPTLTCVWCRHHLRSAAVPQPAGSAAVDAAAHLWSGHLADGSDVSGSVSTRDVCSPPHLTGLPGRLRLALTYAPSTPTPAAADGGLLRSRRSRPSGRPGRSRLDQRSRAFGAVTT